MKEIITMLLSFRPFLSKKGSLIFRVPEGTTKDQFGDRIDEILSPLGETCYRVPDADILSVKNISASAEDIFNTLEGVTSKEENNDFLKGLNSEIVF